MTMMGCASMLGIDDTVGGDIDGDHDGIADPVDNCIGIANPDQADDDHDGIGDACDPSPHGLSCASGTATGQDVDNDAIDDGCDSCLKGPPDDEDGDGVADSCDDCPAIAGTQTDGDSDGVGDPCDLSTKPQTRAAFDGFHRDGAPGTIWVAGSGWTVANDRATGMGRLVVVPGLATLAGPPLGTPAVGAFSIRAKVIVPASPSDNDHVGIELTNTSVTMFCGIVWSQEKSTWQITGASTDGQPPSIAQAVAGDAIAFELWLYNGVNEAGFRCGEPGTLELDVRDFSASGPTFPALRADLPTAFEYVDIIH